MKDNYSIRIYGRSSNIWNKYVVLSIIFFAFIAGARYNVGVDHLNYLDTYNYLAQSGFILKEKEAGFSFIMGLFARAGIHYFFYFAFWASLQITFIYLACKESKFILPYVAILIILGPYFMEWMNGIRQTVVACFFVFLTSKYIVEKKFIWYIILILLASTIHKSAILLLPFCIFGIKPLSLSKKWLTIPIVIACVVLGSTPTWIALITKVEVVLELLGYERYATSFADMLYMEDFSSFSWGPLRISAFLLDILILWFYPKMKEFYKITGKFSCSLQCISLVYAVIIFLQAQICFS